MTMLKRADSELDSGQRISNGIERGPVVTSIHLPLTFREERITFNGGSQGAEMTQIRVRWRTDGLRSERDVVSESLRGNATCYVLEGWYKLAQARQERIQHPFHQFFRTRHERDDKRLQPPPHGAPREHGVRTREAII